MNDEVLISFPRVDLAEANRLASSLALELQRIDPAVSAVVRRTNVETQDLGSMVQAVLGTAFASTVAFGISAWISKQNNPAISIRVRKGDLKEERVIEVHRADKHTAETIRAAIE